MLATAPLWGVASGAVEDLPRIGWLPWGDISPWIDRCLVAVVLVALTSAALDVKRRAAWCIAGLGLASLIVIDQHRMQPWAYQSLAYAGIFSALRWAEGRRWVTAITVSIYAYSAAGKMDFQFAHTVGVDLVNVVTSPFGGLPEASAFKTALLLPIGELFVATLIAWPATRRIGGLLAMVMHGMLIVVLGPWMLDHSWGVLCWNAVLATQSAILFVMQPVSGTSPDSSGWSRMGVAVRLARWPLRVALLIMLLAPLTERHGYWDHWTSWALYSPHNSRADIQIHESAFDRLPSSLRRYLRRDGMSDRWYDLDVDTWSLERRWVPVYPQARYQLAVAKRLTERFELGPGIRVRVKGVADRWTGRRVSQDLIGEKHVLDASPDVTDVPASRW